jgi:catechol 2,3-dioxygenase-like lactoylglutathione lyase family enzyme
MKITRVALALIACAASAAAQSNGAPPPLSGIAHVAIRVADLDASRAFYKKLGFEEAFAFDKGGSPTEAFFKINDTQFIELYPKHSESDTIGFLHVCYLTRDIEPLNQFYQSRGLAPTAVSRGGAGNLLFSLHGPGLDNIEFTQYMPGSRHTNDIGKHLGAHRVAFRIIAVEFPTDDVNGAISFYAKMGFHQKSNNEREFFVTADGLQGIDIMPAAGGHLQLVMDSKDLKQSEHDLRKARIRITYGIAKMVIHDPDGNTIALESIVASQSSEAR